MYDLIQAGANTYYIDCPAKVGIYQLSEGHVCLVDSGSDVSAARKIRQRLTEREWHVDYIINTHSHADHIGGNHYFQSHYDCAIYAKGKELPFITYPIFEPTFLFGGEPIADLKNKFLLAQPSAVQPIEQLTLPQGMRLLPLPGHAPDMIGVITPDNVAFLADSVASELTIQKYHLTYLHDAEGFLSTLEALEALDCACYIPSHTEAVTDLKPLIEHNRNKIQEIAANVVSFCKEGVTFETVLKSIFEHYLLRMDVVQYALIGVTARAYLSYLYKQQKLSIEIFDNQLLWKTL